MNGRPFRYEWDGTVRRLDLPMTVKLVAAYASQYADTQGHHVRPGVVRLATETGLGTATVKRSLKRLRDLGLLELVRSGRSQGRRGKANEYRLVIPDDLLERVDLVQNRDHQKISDHSPQPVENGVDGQPEQGSPGDPGSTGTGITDDRNRDHLVIPQVPVTTPAKNTTPEDHSLSERVVTSREADPPKNDLPLLRLAVDNSRGTGWCLACRADGQYVLAVDTENGTACAYHLRTEEAS